MDVFVLVKRIFFIKLHGQDIFLRELNINNSREYLNFQFTNKASKKIHVLFL